MDTTGRVLNYVALGGTAVLFIVSCVIAYYASKANAAAAATDIKEWTGSLGSMAYVSIVAALAVLGSIGFQTYRSGGFGGTLQFMPARR